MHGSVEIVMIPVSWSMSREEAFLAQNNGRMDEIKSHRMRENEEGKQALADLLSQDYVVVGQTTTEGAGRTLLVFTLYKRAADRIPAHPAARVE